MSMSNSSEKRMKMLKEKVENESGIQDVRGMWKFHRSFTQFTIMSI